jgi:hypothetical protein
LITSSGEKRRVCHVNLLRPYRQRDLTLFPDVEPLPLSVINVSYSDEIELSLPSVGANTTILSVENSSSQLTTQQQSEMSELLSYFEGLFSDKPGRTNLCKQHIELLPDAKPVFCHPYRLSPDKAKVFGFEITSRIASNLASAKLYVTICNRRRC